MQIPRTMRLLIFGLALFQPLPDCYHTDYLLLHFRPNATNSTIMIEIAIPGLDALRLEYLVTDCDGKLLPGSADALRLLADKLAIHVVTADTFGDAAESLGDLPCKLAVLPSGNQSAAKMTYVQNLGASRCVCIGNGRNDRLMLATAALGIAVVQKEGAAVETVMAAKVVAPDIVAALELLLNPKRLIATLRD